MIPTLNLSDILGQRALIAKNAIRYIESIKTYRIRSKTRIWRRHGGKIIVRLQVDYMVAMSLSVMNEPPTT